MNVTGHSILAVVQSLDLMMLTMTDIPFCWTHTAFSLADLVAKQFELSRFFEVGSKTTATRVQNSK